MVNLLLLHLLLLMLMLMLVLLSLPINWRVQTASISTSICVNRRCTAIFFPVSKTTLSLVNFGIANSSFHFLGLAISEILQLLGGRIQKLEGVHNAGDFLQSSLVVEFYEMLQKRLQLFLLVASGVGIFLPLRVPTLGQLLPDLLHHVAGAGGDSSAEIQSFFQLGHRSPVLLVVEQGQSQHVMGFHGFIIELQSFPAVGFHLLPLVPLALAQSSVGPVNGHLRAQRYGLRVRLDGGSELLLFEVDVPLFFRSLRLLLACVRHACDRVLSVFNHSGHSSPLCLVPIDRTLGKFPTLCDSVQIQDEITRIRTLRIH
ncbi:hypothetical protein Mapa_002991 [Marchantia paleacea]|nr:hypothetical protein Mapa_002991 [Marchantia paleacea]